MLDISFKPAGLPQLFPYLIVQDAEKSINFYREAFAFTLQSEPVKNEHGQIQNVVMNYGRDITIMFAPEGACAEMGISRTAPATQGMTASLTLYTYCENVDALYERAIARGARSTLKPHNSYWGDRICNLIDPDGYEWMFATYSNS